MSHECGDPPELKRTNVRILWMSVHTGDIVFIIYDIFIVVEQDK